MSPLGRKSPLGGHGWISSPERRETATFGHSLTYIQVVPGGSSRCSALGQLPVAAASPSVNLSTGLSIQATFLSFFNERWGTLVKSTTNFLVGQIHYD
jgi:hypothetical protein